MIPAIIWALYETPVQPVEVRATTIASDHRHQIALAIWAQQWPSLRHEFSFADAPQQPRKLEGDKFQLTFTERARKPSQEPPSRTLTRPIPTAVPAWAAVLVDDLIDPGDLRAFLRSYGASATTGQAAVATLSAVWAALDAVAAGNGSSQKAVEAVSAALAVVDGSQLVTDVFGDSRSSNLPTTLSEDALLRGAAEGALKGVSPEHLRLFERAKGIARRNADLAQQIAVIAGELPSSAAERKAILSGVGEGLTNAAINDWSDSPALIAVAGTSDTLLKKPRLWKDGDPSLLWPAVRSPRRSRQARGAMLEAMLTSGADRFVGLALKDWPDGPDLLLEAVASNSPAPGLEVISGLDHPQTIAWIRKNGPAPRVVSVLLDTWKPKQLAKIPGEEWTALWEGPRKLPDQTVASLFEAALRPSSRLGPEWATRSYGELARRAGSSKGIGRRALRMLATNEDEPVGVQLAAALATAFISSGWSPDWLFEITPVKAFREVLEADSSGELARDLASREAGPTATRAHRTAVEEVLLSQPLEAAKETIKRFAQHMPLFRNFV